MEDVEYEKLKSELQSKGLNSYLSKQYVYRFWKICNIGSWVVTRGKDPLEKLGLNTFMSYLHRSL